MFSVIFVCFPALLSPAKNNPCQMATPVLYYPSNLCWCGAMAAQLICNQWVAGSTPVTSSKRNPAIYRQNGSVYRGIFTFICVANPSECALFVPYCSKNALSECLTACLVLAARRRGRGGSGCEICGQSGCGCCACRMVSDRGFPITRTSAAYTGLAVRYWVWMPPGNNGDVT